MINVISVISKNEISEKNTEHEYPQVVAELNDKK